MDEGFTIRPYRAADLPRLQEITAQTFGPVSIDRNMEEQFGEFGEGGWQGRKVAAIADDCRLQPDGVFVAEERGEHPAAIRVVVNDEHGFHRRAFTPARALGLGWSGTGGVRG